MGEGKEARTTVTVTKSTLKKLNMIKTENDIRTHNDTILQLLEEIKGGTEDEA